VYALVHPDTNNIGLAYVAGIVLSLMGFWNSVIYIFTSRHACKDFFRTILSPSKRRVNTRDIRVVTSTLGPKSPGQRSHWDDDFERLAEGRD